MQLTQDLIKRHAHRSPAANDAPYQWSAVLRRDGTQLSDPAQMTASEQMFFLGAPLAHVVLHEQVLRQPAERRARVLRAGRL